MTDWLVETRDLTKIYGGGAEIRALDGVSIQVEAGELVTVMGPSGSGKSTLLNMIGALDEPTSGQVFVAGKNLVELENVDQFRAQTVGFIFQLHNLLPTLTAQENVEVPMMGLRSRAERQQRSQRLLEMVGLGDRLHHLPNQLSGGQRQRVAVARSLANEPPLILADEPTGSLDSEAGRELMQLLKDLNREQGTTFLVVTHDPAVARQTDRVLVMEDGRIVRVDEIGSPLDEDLRMWRHSELGEKLLQGDGEIGQELNINKRQLQAIRDVLKLANHDASIEGAN